MAVIIIYFLEHLSVEIIFIDLPVKLGYCSFFIIFKITLIRYVGDPRRETHRSIGAKRTEVYGRVEV